MSLRAPEGSAAISSITEEIASLSLATTIVDVFSVFTDIQSMPSKVAFISHQNYEPESLEKSLRRAIDLCGFDLSGVRGRNVLLKPNMLSATPPAMGITTHPSFVSAVARIFLDAGATVSVGDSPNGVHPVDKVWEVSGMSKICRELGCKEARFEAMGSVERNGIRLSRAALDADIVINLPKFKTHGLTIFTLAVKNLYGCICGMQKTRFHRIYGDIGNFSELLVRIAEIVRPGLTLIDGIVGMDGNGPSGGEPVELGLIVAGTKVHAVDAACCRLLDLEPREMDTIAAAERLQVWSASEEVEFVGDPIDNIRPKRFNLPATYTKGMRDWWISKIVTKRIWSGLSTQPVINAEKCQRCFLCVGSCPVGAILRDSSSPCGRRSGGGETAPRIVVKKCIQCMCCHEVCPYKSIDLKVSWVIKIARFLSEHSVRKGVRKSLHC